MKSRYMRGAAVPISNTYTICPYSPILRYRRSIKNYNFKINNLIHDTLSILPLDTFRP
jgi:hypothetical protein